MHLPPQRFDAATVRRGLKVMCGSLFMARASRTSVRRVRFWLRLLSIRETSGARMPARAARLA